MRNDYVGSVVPADDGSEKAHAGLRVDGVFLRRLARFGAAHGPRWWLRYSPAVFGVAAAAIVGDARRTVRASLVRTRGEAGTLRDAIDVSKTFATFAGALAEGLSAGTPNYEHPEATILGDLHIRGALAAGKGVVLATAHTAGWEIVGPLLGRDHAMRVMMAMQAERDGKANRLHDRARGQGGLSVVHVGDDPLAALELLRHVRGGGAAALQIDRVVPGQKTRHVRLFDAPGEVPEGPLRLAQLTGAPLLPVFCARVGFRRYIIDIARPITLDRRSTDVELDRAAQAMADAMTRFLRAHPTQWLRFHA